MTSVNTIEDSGAISEGLSTMVQPAAIAGRTFSVTWFIGQFHGVISPTTPTGSCRMRSPGLSGFGAYSRSKSRKASMKSPICPVPAATCTALEKSIGAPISSLIACAMSALRRSYSAAMASISSSRSALLVCDQLS